MPRLIVIPLIIILLLVLAGGVLVTVLLDEDKVLELASARLHKETGATLSVNGDKQLTLFPRIGVSLQEVAVTMPQQADLQVHALDIGVQFMPLLSGSLEIDTISLDGLSARIESTPDETPAVDTSKMSDAQLDAFYTQRREAMEAAGEEAGAEAVLALPLALNIKQLLITNSRLELADAAGGAPTVIELHRLQASGLNVDGKPIPLELAVRLAGEQPIELELAGDISVDLATRILSLLDVSSTVSGASAAPLKVQARGEVDLSRQLAKLELNLELGPTRGDGTLRYASFESPQIDTRLKLNLFDPALLALAGPEAAAASDGAGTEPSTGDEPLPLDAIRLIDTLADLQIDQAVFGAHTISNMHIKLRAIEGAVRVPVLTGDLHGGKLDMKAFFNGKHNTATVNSAGGLNSLDIPTALAAVESEPLLTGTASLDWKLAGKGRTVNELIEALNGPVTLSTEQVVLKGMGVEKMLCQAVALVNQKALTAQFPVDTRFQELGAKLRLHAGKVNLQPLNGKLQYITLRGEGELDLLSQDFKTTFKARLSPELETMDPACEVSSRLTAIDWPLKCKGNTSGDPAKWCGVDTQDIIADLTRNEAQRKVEKEAGKLLNKLFK